MVDREAYICAALRTPVGKHGGALAGVRADDLAAIAIKAVVEGSGIDPRAIDDVILGCINQAGEDKREVARMAVLLAGPPARPPRAPRPRHPHGFPGSAAGSAAAPRARPPRQRPPTRWTNDRQTRPPQAPKPRP